MESAAIEFKLVIVGDSGVGKTTFIRKHTADDADRKFIEADSIEITKVTKLTNKGPISFRIWDKAGEDKAGGLSEEDLIGAHCAIIMFEVTKKESYESVPKWYKHLRMVCEEDIPIVIVGNKVDIPEREVKAREITFHRKTGLNYYDISTVSGYQMDKPLYWLFQILLGDINISPADSKPTIEGSSNKATDSYLNKLKQSEGENSQDVLNKED